MIVKDNVKDCVEIFSAFLTPVIAILAAYIAWQQYQVSYFSLKNELYERRFKVFKAFMSYLADIMREGKTSYQRTSQFYAEASEAEFVFEGRILNKLEELYQKGLRLTYFHEQLYPSDGSPGLPRSDERTKVVEEVANLLGWFREQIKETKELFKQHMKVK